MKAYRKIRTELSPDHRTFYRLSNLMTGEIKECAIVLPFLKDIADMTPETGTLTLERVPYTPVSKHCSRTRLHVDHDWVGGKDGKELFHCNGFSTE